MIEINMHFTLLTSEFFMLANIYQMQSPKEKNEGFASMMMNAQTIGEDNKQNPLWCIKLQIMLAPFLRVRNILFSCALSTNTELCRLTANREMQAIDRTNGFNRKAVWAYFKRLFRLYTVEEAKTINVGLFLDILRNAVENVKNNCYFRDLLHTDHIRIVVTELSTLLASPNISENHTLFMKMLNLLDEIYKIVLACGRTDPVGGFIDLKTQQFHSDHFTASRMHYSERAVNLEEVVTMQLRGFSYANDEGVFSTIDGIDRFVTEKCQVISLNPPKLDERSYDVAAHATETERAIAARLLEMNRPAITTDPAAAAAAAATAAAAAASGAIPQLIKVQLSYNALYNFVMGFDPKSTKEKTIIERRGKWLAGCILLIERMQVGAVLLSKPDITTICEKCKALISMIKTHDPPRTLNQLPGLFISATIPKIIRQITELNQGVKGAAASAASAAAAAPASAALAPAPASAAAAQLLSIAELAKPQQPQQPESQQDKPFKVMISEAVSALRKTFKRKPMDNELTDSLLELDAAGGGRRNDLRKTRRMRHNRNHKCSKQLRAHRCLNRNRNRIYTRRRR
jgi:hypothetical protein